MKMQGEQKEQQPQGQQQQEEPEQTVSQKVLNWTKKYLLTARPIFTHLLVLALGSGAVWQYSQLSIQRENQAHDIRKEMIGTQEKLLGIVNEVGDLGAIQNEYERTRKNEYLKKKHALLLTALNEFESRLAQLENRKPRKMEFEMPQPPPTPKGLSIR